MLSGNFGTLKMMVYAKLGRQHFTKGREEVNNSHRVYLCRKVNLQAKGNRIRYSLTVLKIEYE